jgi:hypothetical protein
VTLTTTVFLNSVKNLLSNDKMAELLILFLILLCIVLIVSGIMYKCTDGTMNASDFSFKGCFSFGDGSDDKPQEDKSATEEVTASPLLSDSSSMGSLIGSGSVDGDEGDIDYSSYMDYYTSSTKGVKAREDTYQICRGILENKAGGCGADPVMVSNDVKIYTDYVDVDARNGVGECAKICYDQDDTIDGRSCNAFKMNDDNKTCRLYWSQSESGGDESKKVYRLRNPRQPFDHESEVESELQSGSSVVTFSEKNYGGTKTELGIGQHNIRAESIIVPEGFCVHGYTEKNLQDDRFGDAFSGMISSRSITYDSGYDTSIKSLNIGTWADGICTYYPIDATAAEEHGSATLSALQPDSGSSCVRGMAPSSQGITQHNEFCDSNGVVCDGLPYDQCTAGTNRGRCCSWE